MKRTVAPSPSPTLPGSLQLPGYSRLKLGRVTASLALPFTLHAPSFRDRSVVRASFALVLRVVVVSRQGGFAELLATVPHERTAPWQKSRDIKRTLTGSQSTNTGGAEKHRPLAKGDKPNPHTSRDDGARMGSLQSPPRRTKPPRGPRKREHRRNGRSLRERGKNRPEPECPTPGGGGEGRGEGERPDSTTPCLHS
jgi:hypothetical protein